MSRAMGRPFPFGLTALLVAVVIAVGASARADVTTDQPGSILFFPKVLNDGTRDTIIQISNTGNTLVHAHCFYINASPLIPDQPPGPLNPPAWQELDFFIWLTRQQPTHWSAARGRPINPNDGLGTDTSGIDPGAIPPVSSRFVGDLVCVEIGVDGLPVSGNKLKGEATLKNINTGDVSKYNAVAIKAGPEAGITGTSLQLDNVQYNSCPNTLLLDHFTQGAPDPVAGDFGGCGGPTGCVINTELTLVPCSRDYENNNTDQVTVFFETFNEFEQPLSAQTIVDCWFNEQLDDINPVAFSESVRGTLSAYTRIQPTSGGGLLGVAEESHSNGPVASATAAFQLQIEGSLFDPAAGRDHFDTITLVGRDEE